MTQAKLLIFGIDGADFDVIQSLGEAVLPNLHRWMDQGSYGYLESVKPSATLPNWVSFLTGCNPGEHGVFDFTRRKGYQIEFQASRTRERGSVFSHLDAHGLRTTCYGFPGTWPPERLTNGVFISGWDSPVAFESDASYIHPPSLQEELLARFGPETFDHLNQFRADETSWLERLPAALCQKIARKVQVAKHLWNRTPSDVFAVYFGETDTAAHYLWSLHDENSPRRPAQVSPRVAAGLSQIYQAIDQALGELVQCAEQDAAPYHVLVLSDHGSGGSSDKVLYLNRALEEAGLLRFSATSPLSTASASIKQTFLGKLPLRLKQHLFEAQNGYFSGKLESHVRFGGVDMRHTQVFSDELNYFPALYLNQKGREPQGVVSADDRNRVIENVQTYLHGLRDPWSGQKVVANVFRREELYQGPHTFEAPDLVLELTLDAGYSYNLMPSVLAPKGTGPWRKLSRNEYLGRKGKSLAGSHRPRGVWLSHGPLLKRVGRKDLHMLALTPTWMAALGHSLAGKDAYVEQDLLKPLLIEKTVVEMQAKQRSTAKPSTARLEQRLRALGYID